jgi:hypothetical protein
MSEMDPKQAESGEAHSTYSGMAHFRWQQLPYVVALVLAIALVAYTNVSHQPLVGYWEFLALAIGVVYVITKWPEMDGKEAQLRLIWAQALHWVAVLVTMNIILVSGVQQLLPAPAASLVLLTVVAPGTFLAGVGLLSLQISSVGLAMGIAVPAISWLQQSIIFFLLGAVFTFWLRQDRRRRSAPADTKTHMEA